MSHALTQPALPDLLTIAAAIEHDQQLPDEQRRALDRELATPLLPLADRPVVQLAAWARAVAEHAPPVAQRAEHAATAVRWVTGLAALLGLLLGVGVSLGVFYYDGSGRINVLAVLAVFVALPLALLLPLVVAMLPKRIASVVPGVGPLAELLRAISVGRVAALGVRLLPRAMRDSVAWASDRFVAERKVYGHVQKWAVLAWSQLVAVMFTGGAIITLLCLVTFSDLAFGWSTTLRVDAADVHALTEALAVPWAAMDDAVPTRALVERSRYYRLESAQGPAADPAALGGWWPFLVMAMMCYGLLPRVVMWLICINARRRAVFAAADMTPGGHDVLRRLHRAALRHGAEDAEPDAGATAAGEVPIDTTAPHADAVIIWADAPLDAAAPPGMDASTEPLHAGGASSVAADRAVIEQLAARTPKPTVMLAVKAWEPPMGEVLDFLRDLRAALGEGVAIHVLPVGEATEAQRSDWPRRLSRLRDPWLRVVMPESSTPAAPAAEGGDHA